MLPIGEPSSALGRLDDAALVRRVRGGEPAAFEALIRRHDRRVYRAVRAILRDEDEVEDAMQEAWLHAYAHLDAFQGTAAFATWLVRIALNAALSRVRRRTRAAPGAPGEATMEPASDSEERASAREVVVLLERAIDGLAAPYRLVFVLRAVEGLSTAETAAALGITEAATKVRLHRARSALRRRLAGLVGRAAAEAFPFLAPRCDRVASSVMAALAPLGAAPAS
jgi:RNA polymerase sigma-70 factor, ECF subfamily